MIITGACTRFFPHPPSPEERAKQFVSCFREEFDPTDEQLRTLKEKILVPTDLDRKTADELRSATDDLEKSLESDADEQQLLKKYDRVKGLKSQLAEGHFKKMLVLRSVLTPQQRAKFLVCKRKMGPPMLPHEG